MRNKKGSGLMDYMIPTALVGIIFGTSVYYLVSENKISNFLAASGNLSLDMTKGKASSNAFSSGGANGSPAPGSLGGTMAAPVSKCSDGNCMIDFGKFMLPTVSENFAQDVELNGSSIQTDHIAAIYEDLAEQLDDPSTPADEGAAFRDLANLTHFLAANQKVVEDAAKVCEATAASPMWCLSGKLDKLKSNSAPSNISSMLSIDTSTETIYDLLINQSLGDIMSAQKNSPAYFASQVDKNPLFAAVDKFDSIINDPNIPDSVKALSAELFRDIDDMAYNFQKTSKSVHIYTGYPDTKNPLISMTDNSFTRRDPITGDVVETGKLDAYSKKELNIKTTTVLTNPKASLFTDLDSAIICTAGKDIDTGKACHK